MYSFGLIRLLEAVISSCLHSPFQDNTLLEACIENHTKSNLYMDQVEFEPAQQWIATRLEVDEHTSETNSKTR